MNHADVLRTGACSLCGAGGLLEAVADHQKQAVKNKDANKFASSGVFRICRHPAYLGEVAQHRSRKTPEILITVAPAPGEGHTYPCCLVFSLNSFSCTPTTIWLD